MSNSNLPLQELSISDLFNSTDSITYEIPIYQRNYAWEKDEIEALVNDVWDAYKADKDTYYIGTLVTFDKGESIFEVIDGQQRLTTLYLLLKVLNAKITNKLTYRARERSNKTIERIPDFDHDGLDAGIKKGYDFADSAIKEIVENKDTIPFTEYLLKRVHIIQYNVPRDVDLNHYFEVMNSRGEQLEKHEIVKAKLIGLLDGEERAKFSRVWQACSEMDSFIQVKYPQADTVFDDHLSSFNKHSFEDLPDIIETDKGACKLKDLIKSEPSNTLSSDDLRHNKMFQPIIDFPNFLLIVLKITRIEENEFNPTSFILDDKELIREFDEAKPDRDFAKRFCFNLLQAKFFLDNFVVHHSNEDDTIDSNPWQLQRWYSDGKSSYPKNLSDDNDLQERLTQILSMFEVSFTARQRKNYLFYCIYHLFNNRDLKKYYCFLSDLAHKFFCDIYLNKKWLNEINTPIPGAFDQVIIKNKKLNLHRDNSYPYFKQVFGDGNEKTRGIPLFIFNYIDFQLWERYQKRMSGEKLKEESKERKAFFDDLGCSDFGLNVFNQFYFSRTRRSLEHYYPQANIGNDINENQINCLGNFAMIGSEANSMGSNWSPKEKLNRYLDSSKKISLLSVASLKFRIMLQICSDNCESKNRETGKEWIFEDIQKHQDKISTLLESILNESSTSVSDPHNTASSDSLYT